MRADTTSPAAIAEAAFVSAYPLLTRRRLMVQATAVTAPEPATMRAPVNALVHGRATPDTLRCSAWLDLAGGPIVLSVPDTWGRYYALWLRDAWGRVFASIGARTTGTARRDFLVLGPQQGAVQAPPGQTPIAAPTRTVQVTGRIEAVGEADARAVARGHGGFRLEPLNGRAATPPLDDVDVIDLDALVRLVADEQVDSAAVDRLGGLVRAPAHRENLERGLRRGRAAVRAVAQTPTAPRADGWTRATGDPVADVLHLRIGTDSAGRPLTGEQRYLLRFAPDASPPVHGFWELTAGASSIGDRHPLALAADGALEIHIQHAPAARARRWNWLPAPGGPFNVSLHLYWPRDEAWSAPAIRRLE